MPKSYGWKDCFSDVSALIFARVVGRHLHAYTWKEALLLMRPNDSAARVQASRLWEDVHLDDVVLRRSNRSRRSTTEAGS